MRLRIAALAVVSLLATAFTAGAAPAQAGPDGAGPPPSRPTAPPGQTPPPGAAPSEAWAWTQLTSNGTEIRYVSTDTSQTCPWVRYTDPAGVRSGHPMLRVSTPLGQDFPTTVCELGPVPLGSSDAVIDRTTVRAAVLHPANGRLPLPTWTSATRPGRIAVIGDSGCDVPVTGVVQNCADHQNGWPFQRIADSAATVTRPDLVVHTGDYLYREDPGRENDPAANPGCTTLADHGSWACVVADFFRPAERLLGTSPVVLARGNHEDCNNIQQGGAGGAWFRYLADQLRSNNSCSRYSPPAAIRAGTLNLINLDSSYADPADNGSTAQRDIYAAQFETVNQDAQQHPAHDYFVVTHKPVWMVKAAGFPVGNVEWVTPVLDEAVARTTLGRLRDNVRMVLSGHIHLYQMLAFNTARPPQLTVGSSGATLVNGPDDRNVERQSIGTPPQRIDVSRTQTLTPGGMGVFGYGDLRSTPTAWRLAFRQPNGQVRGQTCTLSTSLANKTFACI
ncbi:metallophosphoesterase [Streptomyces sp. NPDC047108]|uniref:metallophosphoesterase family protein n=1 Tax=Streptomyces sp. NPDC047108 TaxID=3155025 RepID=UPI0033C9EAF6